jgi:hypothetical protein
MFLMVTLPLGETRNIDVPDDMSPGGGPSLSRTEATSKAGLGERVDSP